MMEGKLLKSTAIFTPENTKKLFACFFPAPTVGFGEEEVVSDMFGATNDLNAVLNKTLEPTKMLTNMEAMTEALVDAGLSEAQMAKGLSATEKAVKLQAKKHRINTNESGAGRELVDAITNPQVSAYPRSLRHI